MIRSLSEGLLPSILRELYVERKTGVLSFGHGAQRRALHFRKGHIVRGESNVKDEMGLPEGRSLEDAQAQQVREIINKALSKGDASYAFEEQAARAETRQDAEITLKLSTGELILEAVRQVKDPDVLRYALGDIDRILAPSSDPLLRFQRINLTPADGYILSRIDGTLSAREIILLSPTEPEETERSLFGLLCTGVIEYVARPPKAVPAPAPRRKASPPAVMVTERKRAPTAPPPSAAQVEARKALDGRRQEIIETYEGLKSRNHFEVLGIPKASNLAQVKEAYFGLAKRFHPDTHHDANLRDLQDKIEAIFIRLGQAYEVLRDRNKRASYESDLAARAPRAQFTPAPPSPEPLVDPEADARMAEESIRRAEKYMAEEKYWDAIQLLEPAVASASGKWKARARLALARGYLKNPLWLKRAEEVLQTLVREDAQNAEAYFLLGTLYKQGGLRSRAASMFRRALEVRPEHEQAAGELAALAAPEPTERPPESRSILKKLFGRS